MDLLQGNHPEIFAKIGKGRYDMLLIYIGLHSNLLLNTAR